MSTESLGQSQSESPENPNSDANNEVGNVETKSSTIDYAKFVSPNKKKCPPPGIYYDVPFEEYVSWNAMNGSTLAKAIQNDGVTISMKHLRAALNDELKTTGDSNDKRWGRAWHCRVLEPELFKKRFVQNPTCGELLKNGDRKGRPCGKSASFQVGGAYYCGVHCKDDGAVDLQDYVTDDDLVRVNAAYKELMSHDVIRMIRTQGGFEATIVWDYNGVPMKSRLDKLIEPTQERPAVVLDLKKCQVGHATDEAISYSMRDYSYHVKMVSYGLAVKSLFPDFDFPFLILVFQEDNKPFDVNVKDITEWQSIGHKLFESIMSRFIKCCDEIGSVETSKWPGVGYVDSLKRNDIGLSYPPAFYQKKFN